MTQKVSTTKYIPNMLRSYVEIASLDPSGKSCPELSKLLEDPYYQNFAAKDSKNTALHIALLSKATNIAKSCVTKENVWQKIVMDILL